jgi:hypothetical protein
MMNFFFVIFFILNVAACGGGSDNANVTLNGYVFNADSATLTSQYFPGKAGDTLHFHGVGAFEGESYTWTFGQGPVIQGVATIHEKGTSTAKNGTESVIFESMLAQDTNKNIHVLRNIIDGKSVDSGVAAGVTPTLLMLADPKVGDSFGPNPSLYGVVTEVNVSVDGYSGVLHSRLVTKDADGKTADTYDDYWAPGVGQIRSVWKLQDGSEGYWTRLTP